MNLKHASNNWDNNILLLNISYIYLEWCYLLIYINFIHSPHKKIVCSQSALVIEPAAVEVSSQVAPHVEVVNVPIFVQHLQSHAALMISE